MEGIKTSLDEVPTLDFLFRAAFVDHHHQSILMAVTNFDSDGDARDHALRLGSF
jgi:hypothetical protein